MSWLLDPLPGQRCYRFVVRQGFGVLIVRVCDRRIVGGTPMFRKFEGLRIDDVVGDRFLLPAVTPPPRQRYPYKRHRYLMRKRRDLQRRFAALANPE